MGTVGNSVFELSKRWGQPRCPAVIPRAAGTIGTILNHTGQERRSMAPLTSSGSSSVSSLRDRRKEVRDDGSI